MPRTRSRSSDRACRWTRRASASSRAAVGIGAEQFLGEADAHAERDEPGLRAVVQVPLDAAQLGGLGVDRVGPGLGQLAHPLGQLGRPWSGAGRARERRLEPGQPAGAGHADGQEHHALREDRSASNRLSIGQNRP